MNITSFKHSNKLHWCIAISSCDNNLDLETEIKSYLSINYTPEIIYLLRPHNEIQYEVIKERIPNFENIKIIECVYLENGLIINLDENDLIAEEIYFKISNSICSHFLVKYDSILKAGLESYFLLPSEVYATHFIRIGNIFKESQDINILSIFLLPYFKNNAEIIYSDTPTIFPLIYSCILYKNISTSVVYNPRIKLYSSSNVTRDDIENIDNSLFIVSTSINGSLPNKLNTLGIDWSKIVVLFGFDKSKHHNYSIMNKQNSLEILGNEFVSKRPDEFKKAFPNRTFEIKFGDEQFIPSPPIVSKFKIILKDAPDNLSDLMFNYLAYDFVSCYKGQNSLGKTRDIYIDVSKLFIDINGKKLNHFEKKTKNLIINQLPINIKSIIYVDDAESKYIADKIQEYYQDAHSKTVESVFYKNLKLDDTFAEPSCYLVCSSCISNGKKISDVSRKLRTQEHSQIIYFNGFVRCIDEKAYSNLMSNIKYGKYNDFSTYSFITIDKILLPNEDSDSISWEFEKDLIKTLLFGFDDFETKSIMTSETKEYFEKRYNELNDNKDGLINNVYLNKSNGNRLVLNKNFAFFKFTNWKPEEIQQSKVYFSILSVLHNFRIKKNIKQTIFERHIFDPENFNRYNDGIIQASFLRAATNKELNYEIDINSSSLMATIIIGSIDENTNKDTAPYEFLMAICIGKLTLHKNDLISIYEKFKDFPDNIIEILLKIIHSKFLI
ncbi:hypothetical protein [Flavobacterium muglaense]|uniref:Uncharacterized protein n=1 Tax=Flavobacterium muglaense TaxID=2764716 RepID=A0A923MYQ3_9FLAO|nr:hypothetical protein [Flavobacterium muglaense]MBC5837569.1 hypothetical protein [Flavobacterium muglaense]MBC5844096.1 hypothetical protein [Flavobacterium muglaense]